MESFFARYRNYLVLLTILVAQMIGLAVQVRRTGAGRSSLGMQDGEGVRLIRLWANTLVSPPERFVHSSRMLVAGLWQNYFDLRHTRAENQQLQQTIDRLRLEQAALLEDARQGQRLEGLMGFQQKYLYGTQAAQIFGTGGSNLSRVLYIDKGSADKLERDMAVITPDGIVGKVREVLGRHSAQVLAINDQNSGAGVILETTRIRGILRGNADGRLQIVDLLADKRIQPGEKVLTAGGDQIFPRGLPVGEVEKVVNDPDRDGFIKIMVRPAAHLDRLDEVLVITSMQPRFSPQEQNDLATSEALKGAEAASLDEQRKASTIMAERLPGLTDPNAPPKPVDPNAPQPSLLVVAPAKPLKPIHPDRFSPGAAPAAQASAPAGDKPKAQAEKASSPTSRATNQADSDAGAQPAPGSPDSEPKPQRHP